MRDESWLINRFYFIWQTYFPEIERKNHIIIKFKGKWRNKFGHIKKLKGNNTEIVVNYLFKDEKIPDYVIDITIAHEIVHYMHGFNSPHEKRFTHPHKGNIVNRELNKRGLDSYLKLEKRFIKEEWPNIIKEFKPARRIYRRSIFKLF